MQCIDTQLLADEREHIAAYLRCSVRLGQEAQVKDCSFGTRNCFPCREERTHSSLDFEVHTHPARMAL